jgi:hypothetical protein
VLGRPAKPAAALAGKIKDPTALDTITGKETRMAVWAALAANPNLPPQILDRVYAYGAAGGESTQRKLARALIDRHEHDDDRVHNLLTLLTDHPWIAQSPPGRELVSSFEYSISRKGTALTDILLYASLGPTRYDAQSVLNRMLNARVFGEDDDQLTTELVVKLLSRFHDSDCTVVCPRLATWAAQLSYADAVEVIDATGCATMAAAVLDGFYVNGDVAAAQALSAKLAECLIGLDAPTSGYNPSYERNRKLSTWQDLAQRQIIYHDAVLARALFAVLEHETTSRPGSNVKLGYIDPEQLALFAQSRHPALKVAAVAQYADPLRRVHQAVSLFEDNAIQSPLRRELANAIRDNECLEEIARWCSDLTFPVVSRWVWTDRPSRRFAETPPPQRFAIRSIETLAISQLSEVVAVFDVSLLDNLFDRVRSLSDPEQAAELAESLLIRCIRQVSNDQRHELLSYARTEFILGHLPNWMPDPDDPAQTPPHPGAVHVGELAALLAANDPITASTRLNETTKRKLVGRLIHATQAESWMDEAMRLVPIEHVSLGAGAWAMLGRILHANYGDDKPTWELALGLLETWDATLAELLEAVNLLK